MADEPQVVRGINWREAFSFTHIFRAFRIAIHPSKLALALIALVILYVGGRVLDGMWSSGRRAVADEIGIFERSTSAREYFEKVGGDRVKARENAARELQRLRKDVGGIEESKLFEALKARVMADPGKAGDDIAYEAREWLKRELPAIHKKYDEDAGKPNLTADQKRDVEQKRRTAVRDAFAIARQRIALAESVEGQGLFDAFFKYQITQMRNVWQGVVGWNWLGGLPGSATTSPGVAVSTYKFFAVAPSWALRHHWLYFFLFGTLFLVVWSLFGGAIARIAAVHVADEGRKLSIRQGLSFAVSKFLSFLSAPLIPVIIIAVIGLALAVGGLLVNIPWIGPIVVGGVFFLALAAGFVITLVVLGMAGGFNLMYPTIAVEGSDSFDAISRSFSYVYARPWRMLLYSAVAIAYGSLTYLFVRVFIWLVLLVTWFFVGLFVFRTAGNGADLFATMMPAPTFGDLAYDIDTLALPWAGSVGAFLASIWVYLTISMLGAFAVSFYFSASTIIYYLLRKEVDATEMNDVYLEQSEEDFAETPPPAAAAGPADNGGSSAAPPSGA